ncbi:MAG: hypothetical protein IKU43_08790 [Clostridia bacterium]|nr:hypothetical protein [Clostridia bacterium]
MKIVYQHDPYFVDFSKADDKTVIDSFFYFYDKQDIKPDIILWETHRFIPQECECNDFDVYKSLASQGRDMMSLVLAEARKRGIKSYWNHRICEVDNNGTAYFRKGIPNDIKLAHPDWVIKTWWEDGMWNLANSELRKFKLEYINKILSKYDFDGICIDFLRHTPCLPPGKQWELRSCVSEFMRDVRRLTTANMKCGVKIPGDEKSLRVDGFDIEAWTCEGSVDFIVAGSRSISTDVAYFKSVVKNKEIEIYPCHDTWHASDACHHREDEFYAGIFSNWAKDGADGICGFNYMSCPAEEFIKYFPCDKDFRPSRPFSDFVRQIKLSEDDSSSKIFAVERRGGYPYGEGAGCNNIFAQLPIELNANKKATVTLKASKQGNGILNIVLSGHKPNIKNADIRVWLNDIELTEISSDRCYIDRQIFYPEPQRASGASYCYTDTPSELLLISARVGNAPIVLGDNIITVKSTVDLNMERTELQVL